MLLPWRSYSATKIVEVAARLIIGADGSRAMDGFLNQVVTPHALQKQAAPARVRNQIGALG